MLMLCRRCCSLFWKSIGHPCLIPEHMVMSSSSSTSGCIATPHLPSAVATNDSAVDAPDEVDIAAEKEELFDEMEETQQRPSPPPPHDNMPRRKSGDKSQFELSPDLFVPVTPETFLTFFSV